MNPAWLGVDLGTQSARVLVLDDRGTRLALHAAPLVSTREGGRHEQDPLQWLAVVQGLLRRTMAELPDDVRVEALAVSGTSGTIVPLDTLGNPAGAAVMYDDRRGSDRLDQAQAAGEAVWSRLGYRMQATWGLPKLLQLREDLGAEVLFGHQPDVITSWLLGYRAASDLSSALKSGADLDEVSWPVDVFDSLGLPITALTDVVASGSVLGAVGHAVADRTGLPVGCQVIAGSTDGCAAQFASGALRPGSWNSVLGTTLVVKGASEERFTDPAGAVYAHRAPFDAGWLPGGASNTGARAVSALLPGRDLDALTTAVAARDDLPVAYPLIGTGERFPFVSDAAEAFWPGGRRPSSDEELFHAIAVGIALLERYSFDRLAEIGYDTGGPIHMTGGGSRNAWWNSLRAAVLDRPAVRPKETEGAAGMALLAAAGSRAAATTSDAEVFRTTAARLVGDIETVEPMPASRSRLDDAYEEFRGRLTQQMGVEP